jgi:hypothetical protein
MLPAGHQVARAFSFDVSRHHFPHGATNPPQTGAILPNYRHGQRYHALSQHTEGGMS